MAKRAARRNAKILVKLEAFIIMDEIWQDEQELMWDDDDYYMDFDFGYFDEVWDYPEEQSLKEMEDLYIDYGYDAYFDWDY